METSLQPALVSIIVPSYNHERYISQCVESIINQTYPTYELIVVDDGSTDNSIAILKDLQKKYQFELILQSNQGLSKTLTNLIQHKAMGKYISVCASDDYWAPTKMEEQVRFLEAHPDHPMCFTKCYYVDEKSVIIGTRYHYATESRFKSGNLFEDLFLLKYHLPVSYMYRKSILEEINYFPQDVYCEDFYMNLKIGHDYPIGFIDSYLMYYRFQRNSPEKTIKIMNSQKQIIDLYTNHPLYMSALRCWKLRAISTYSYYPKLKKHGVRYLFDLSLVSDVKYWKSVIKFIFKW